MTIRCILYDTNYKIKTRCVLYVLIESYINVFLCKRNHNWRTHLYGSYFNQNSDLTVRLCVYSNRYYQIVLSELLLRIFQFSFPNLRVIWQMHNPWLNALNGRETVFHLTSKEKNCFSYSLVQIHDPLSLQLKKNRSRHIIAIKSQWLQFLRNLVRENPKQLCQLNS